MVKSLKEYFKRGEKKMKGIVSKLLAFVLAGILLIPNSMVLASEGLSVQKDAVPYLLETPMFLKTSEENDEKEKQEKTEKLEMVEGNIPNSNRINQHDEDYCILPSDHQGECMTDLENKIRKNMEGLSPENPLEVPEEGLAFSGGVVYGISQEWYKNKKTEITGQENPEENPDFTLYLSVTIPEEINHIPVRMVAMESFTNQWTNDKSDYDAMYVYNNEGSRHHLNIGAFYLVEVDFSQAVNLEVMEQQAFNHCTALTGVVDLSNTKIEVLEKMTFQECQNLKGIVLPDTLKEIGSSVFLGCTSLNFITTKDQYESSNPDFIDFTLPDGLKTIGNRAFAVCFADVALTVVIPESVETLGSEVFYAQWNNSGLNYLPVRTIIVENADISGYDGRAFKFYSSGVGFTYPPRTAIMPDESAYTEFMKKVEGNDPDKDSISYPMDVSFYAEENPSGEPYHTERKLYNQSIRYTEKGGLWSYDETYVLPEIPGGIDPQPGYQESVWMMNGKELTVDSKVTSDVATLRAGGKLIDPEITFQITAISKNGEKEYVTMKSGQILKLPINNYDRLDIVPEISHPLGGTQKDDIFFWYKWNDSMDERDGESAFKFGKQINTLVIDDITDARKGSAYYQLDLEGKKVGSNFYGPDYDWDGNAIYTSKEKQYYIRIDLYITAENLDYVSASDWGYFVEDSRYALDTIYETSNQLILEYLEKTFGTETDIYSENKEEASLSIDWSLKDNSVYSNEPGETSIFVWTASQDEFEDLGWTNQNNVSLTGELTVRNPYAVQFAADGKVIETKYLIKGSGLKFSDFPNVPEKSGYIGAWDVTTDIMDIAKNQTITAVYTPITYQIKYELNGGKNNANNPASYTIEEDIILKNPSKSGYVFDGWTYPGETKPKTNLTISAGTITGELVFTAHWTKESEGSSSGRHTTNRYYIRYRNGEDVVNDGKYTSGEIVTIKGNVFSEPEGKELAGWSLDENGKIDYKVGDRFPMPRENLDLYAVWKNQDELIHEAYISGYPDGTVGPDKFITRAEAATMFYNLSSSKTGDGKIFSDVPMDQWYSKAVMTLAGEDILTGYPDGTFRPNDSITRAEFVTMALNFAGENQGAVCDFEDVPENMWYYGIIAGATEKGWVSGYPDGTFRADTRITRGEATSIINRMQNRSADLSYLVEHKNELCIFSDLPYHHWAYEAMMEAANEHSYESKDDFETWLEIR